MKNFPIYYTDQYFKYTEIVLIITPRLNLRETDSLPAIFLILRITSRNYQSSNDIQKPKTFNFFNFYVIK